MSFGAVLGCSGSWSRSGASACTVADGLNSGCMGTEAEELVSPCKLLDVLAAPSPLPSVFDDASMDFFIERSTLPSAFEARDCGFGAGAGNVAVDWFAHGHDGLN